MKKYTRTHKLTLSAVFAVTLIFLGGVGLAESSSHDTGFVVTPRSQSLEVGQSASFRALVDPYNCYQVGGCIGIEDVTSSASWSVSNSSVLKYEGNGVFSAQSPGETQIRANYAGKTSSSEVEVIESQSIIGSGDSGDESFGDAQGISFIKTVFEIPVELPYSGIHYQYKQDAIYVNGVYAISGQCGGGIGAGDISRFASVTFPPGGGLWAFSEDGNLIDERNVCKDAGSERVGVSHHSIGRTTLMKNSEGFVATTKFSELGPDNSAIYYSVTGSSISLESTVPARDIGGNKAILVDDYLIGERSQTYDGNIPVYELPQLSLDQENSLSVSPKFGIGDYMVAEDRVVSGAQLKKQLKVYKISGGDISFVKDLEEVAPYSISESVAFAFDNSSGKVALYQNGQENILVYEPSSDGLKLDKEIEVPWSSTDLFESRQNYFGISGETIAYPVENGFNVWKDGEKIGEATLPPTKSYNEVNNLSGSGYGNRSGDRTPHNFAISPSGRILAVNEYGAYLYNLGGGSGSLSGPPSSIPVPENLPFNPDGSFNPNNFSVPQNLEPDPEFFNNLADSFTESFFKFFSN